MIFNHSKNKCNCTHHQIVPILMLLFSVTFLLGYAGMMPAGFVNFIWPVLIGVAAITKLGENSCKCC